MTNIHHTRSQIDAYLDGEMPDRERDSFLAHDNECNRCRARVESRRNLLRAIREAQPEAQASPDLRRNIAAALDSQAAAHTHSSRPSGQNSLLTPLAWFPAFRFKRAYAWLLPILLAAGFALHFSRQQMQARLLVETAIDSHQRRLAGAAPLEFESASARDITRWCNSRLPFALRLPTYQDDSGDHSRYQLIGASRIPFSGKKAAYIAYRMGKEHISLIIVPAEQAIASGGVVTKAKSLVFHSVRRDGLEIITWSVHNLTYALVSSVDSPPKQSCVVCHANPKDRQWLQGATVHRAPSSRDKLLLGLDAFVSLQTLRSPR